MDTLDISFPDSNFSEKITSLTEIDIPDTVKTLHCSSNNLTNFIGINKNITKIFCDDNKIDSWEGLEGMHLEYIVISNNPISTIDKMPKIDIMVCRNCLLPILQKLSGIDMVDFKHSYMIQVNGPNIDIKRGEKDKTLWCKDENITNTKVWLKDDERVVYMGRIKKTISTTILEYEKLDDDSPFLKVFDTYDCKRIWLN